MKILVVEDHPMYLESLVSFLKIKLPQSEIHEARNGFEAVDVMSVSMPDLILLDVNMPGMNGLKVAERVLAKQKAVKVIVITNVNGEAMVLHLLKVGVHGFLFKSCGPEEMHECIEKVLAGEKYFCAEVEKLFVENIEVLGNLPIINFTQRELNIIQLLMDGKTSKQIAYELQLKATTVNSYRDDLLKKTKTKNTTELVAFAVQNILVSQ